MVREGQYTKKIAEPSAGINIKTTNCDEIIPGLWLGNVEIDI